MGAVDGVLESVSYLYEHCLGWRGVLVEANPDVFPRLTRNRPHTLNLRVAACRRHGYVNFGLSDLVTTSSAADRSGAMAAPPAASSLVSSMCGPIGDYLRLLHVARLDLCACESVATSPFGSTCFCCVRATIPGSLSR